MNSTTDNPQINPASNSQQRSLFVSLFFTSLLLFSSSVFASPSDPRFSIQWYLEQTNDVDMDYEAAQAMTVGQQKSEVVVAVIDSAMDLSNPDLSDKLWHNPNETMDGLDNDGNGLVDDNHGWDFRNNDNNVFDQVIPHATAVAGIIAATANNNFSISGVAGDFPVRIMPLQIVNINDIWKRSCQFNFEVPTFEENLNLAYAFLAAFNYAIDQGVDVINASLGYALPDDLTAEQEQIAARLIADFETAMARAEEKKIMIVIAAGNANNHYYFNPANPDQLMMDYIAPVVETYTESVNGENVEKCRLTNNQNGDREYQLHLGKRPEFPALFAPRFRNIIPVASIDEQGTLASWLVGEYLRGDPRLANDHSAYGDIVLLAAPGTNIQSTWPLYDQNFILPLMGSNNGTSFAAPMVSGALAMILSLHPELRASNTTQSATDPIEIMRDILLHGVKKTEALSYNAEINASLVLSGGYLHLPTLLNYARQYSQ